MRINRVLDWYYRAYDRAARNAESGRGAINALKGAVGAEKNPARYERLRRFVIRFLAGPFYWPNTFPTGVDEAVASALYSLVRLARPEIAVEIGTAKGNSTIAIAQALEDGGRGMLHTMDPESQVLVHVAIRKSGLGNRIRYRIGYSHNVIPRLGLKNIGFAFVDGDHAYESAKADFELVRGLMAPGGIIAFHDAHLFEGVQRVVREAEGAGFAVITLPSLTGNDAQGNAALAPYARGDFNPVGLAVCVKR